MNEAFGKERKALFLEMRTQIKRPNETLSSILDAFFPKWVSLFSNKATFGLLIEHLKNIDDQSTAGTYFSLKNVHAI